MGTPPTETGVKFIYLLLLLYTTEVTARLSLITTWSAPRWRFTQLAKEVKKRTSLELSTELDTRSGKNFNTAPWLWTRDLAFVKDSSAVAQWLRKGGMLIVEGTAAAPLIEFTARTFGTTVGSWQNIPLDHELMRSFYLLNALPLCNKQRWQGFTFAGRLAIVSIPHHLLTYLRDKGEAVPCLTKIGRPMTTRLFINLLMVALAGDYKKDQVHLPEILKRLR